MPSSWEQALDEDSGQVYYFNRLTGETSWTPPPASENGGEADDAGEWLKAFDEASQTSYYYNTLTGETSWTPPIVTEPSITQEDLTYLTYSVVQLQARARGHRARRRVSRLVRARYQLTRDPETGQTLYTDRQCSTSSWLRPALFSRLGVSEDDSDGGENDDDDDDDFEAFKRDASRMEDDDGDGGGVDGDKDEDGGVREDDGDPVAARKQNRAYPRSIAQQRVDAAEDAMDGTGGNRNVERDGEASTAAAISTQRDTLDMSGLQCWRLSSRIWNLTDLRTLSLAHNQLTRIPSGLQDLVNLTSLDVSCNHLTRLPSCLQTTTTLQHLAASHNRISSFSPRLWKLRSLETLDLSWNQLTELPYIEGDLKLLRDTREWQVGVGLLKALESLNISHNRLTQFPRSIGGCASLMKLDLSHNQLTELTDELGDLMALQCVDLAHNSLSELPESIGELAILERLVLDHNRLVTLPDAVGQLQCLHELSIGSNQIVQIPESCGALAQLAVLTMDHNPHLAALPSSLRALPSVTMISAVSCGIVDFDALDLFHGSPVIRFVLRDNALSDFPLLLSQSAMKDTLQELDLAWNALSSFPMELVAAAASSCSALTHLNLSHNRLRVLPAAVCRLRSLQHLDVSFNALRGPLPDTLTALGQLCELRAQRNQLTSLPLALGALSRLTHLNVSSNQLTALPTSIMQIANSLRALYAHSNAFQTRPPVTMMLSTECHVDLSNNPFCDAREAARPRLAAARYATAVRLFHEQKYVAAEKELSVSLGEIVGDEENEHEHEDASGALQRWRDTSRYSDDIEVRPSQMLLRGLARYMMMKNAEREIEQAAQEIRECELQLDSAALRRKPHHRVGHRNNKEKYSDETPEAPEFPTQPRLPLPVSDKTDRGSAVGGANDDRNNAANNDNNSGSDMPLLVGLSSSSQDQGAPQVLIDNNQEDLPLWTNVDGQRPVYGSPSSLSPRSRACYERLTNAASRLVTAREVVARQSEAGMQDMQDALARNVRERVTAYHVQGLLLMTCARFAEAADSFTHALHAYMHPQAPTQHRQQRRVGLMNDCEDEEALYYPLASVPLLLLRADAFRRLGQLPAALRDVRTVLRHHAPPVTASQSKNKNKNKYMVNQPLALAVTVMEKQEEVQDAEGQEEEQDPVAMAMRLEEAMAQAWATQRSEYFVDHEMMFRAFDVDEPSGLARRPLVVDDSMRHAPVTSFQAQVELLVAQAASERETQRQAFERGFQDHTRVLQLTRAFRHELRESLRMALEEEAQRAVERELVRLEGIAQAAREQQAREREWMEYEEQCTRWLLAEQWRLSEEARLREEEARRRAEAKAVYETRLARRGGRRQQLARKNAPSPSSSSSSSSRRQQSPSKR